MRPERTRMAAFVRFAATLPRADDLIAALHDGPLAPLGVRATTLFRLPEPDLVAIVATVGTTPQLAERYGVFSLSAPLMVSRCIREGIVVREPAHGIVGYLAGLDADLWHDALTQVRGRLLVAVPVRARGQVVGSLGVIVDRSLSAAGEEVLAAAASVLGLWVTHPQASLPALGSVAAHVGTLVLSARQREILHAVADGQTTPAIARQLGVSPSVVKQDLGRAMRAMRANDRATAARRAADLGLL